MTVQHKAALRKTGGGKDEEIYVTANGRQQTQHDGFRFAWCSGRDLGLGPDHEVHLPGESLELPRSGNMQNAGVGMRGLLSAIDQMQSAKEIEAYVAQLKDRNDPIVTDELAEIVKQSAYIEKMYGNNYKECAQRIFKLFGFEYKPQDNRNKVVCRQCGKVIDEPSAAFCTACGTPIVR